MEDIIAGRNPVREALLAGQPLNKIYLAYGTLTGPLQEIFNLARGKNIPVQRVDRARLAKFAPEVAHQGVVALVASKEYVELDDILDSVPAGADPFLILLDEVNDPHNLG
ncbi:MAG: 23S rRNA (guanosine(2251)-2'-O)-methyltransferase RlmB, partial [Firmicutes bacterium]|nr:23S rRNA (guanosine(2251)-2'-O)-methyltransferase RlmB [Bacillota bacterium]